MRYADSNVQAWAQYYAQGGKDPTGAVYFISVPGVKEPVSPQPTPPQPTTVPSTATTTTGANPNPNPVQSHSRHPSLYNPYGAPEAGDDLGLENPYDERGASGPTNFGYGASPYQGLTRDMAGMDIKS